MKRTLFQSIIQEIISEGITAYHGSPKKFNRFDLSFLGTGDGRSVYGDGVYLSLKRDEAETYSNNGYLYTVDVAGYNGDNYILWNESLGRGIAGRVAEALKKEGAPECDELAEKIIQDGGKMKGEMLFMYLREIFYPNQLGELFRTANVSGALVPSKTVARRDRLIDLVIYKPEDVRITNIETIGKPAMNESINEGGNAVSSAQPVRGDLAGEIARDVIQAVSRAFGCAAEPAGSTGKKGPEMTSGDIDILLDLPWEKNPEVEQWVKESFPNCEMAVQPGFKQISFGYQYDEGGTPKVAQVDLMFTSNINWRRWSAYSPSPYESKFKGLVQTVLLKLIARSKPIDKEKFPDEFYTAEDYGGGYEGMMKSHWRYMWDAEMGLVIVHRTNLGKKRPIKPYTIKEDTIVVTSNPDEAMKLIFGPEATLADMKSPETMVAFMFSGKYEYATPELLQRIHDGVMANKEMEKVPGAIENFEALWNEYAGKEEPQGEPAYSQAIQEIHDLYRRMKKTED